jgi:hypothetical protein
MRSRHSYGAPDPWQFSKVHGVPHKCFLARSVAFGPLNRPSTPRGNSSAGALWVPVTPICVRPALTANLERFAAGDARRL